MNIEESDIIWKDIPEYSDYQASDKGQIRKGNKIVKQYIYRYWNQQHSASTEYASISIHGKNQYVHRLVASAFIGSGKGKIVRHGPGGSLDNSIENLCYGTQYENMVEDRKRDGTFRSGDKVATSKLTNSDVVDIKSLLALPKEDRPLLKEIAADYFVDITTISRIKRGIDWKDVVIGCEIL